MLLFFISNQTDIAVGTIQIFNNSLSVLGPFRSLNENVFHNYNVL